MPEPDPIRILSEEILSDDYCTLKKVTYEQRRRDGGSQQQAREIYDCASGATVLPYDRSHRSVLLVRQFRLGARLNGHDGFLLEAPAGVLDGADPAERARCEALEETGYAIGTPRKALSVFVSPGSVTERNHLFVAEYDHGRPRQAGGGKPEEGEDIEVVELDFDDALALVDSGAIVDAKTVLLLAYLERKVLGRHGEAS
jgi:nudix-type nucleoside diphosphatase (YffH/AdpP family)